MATLAHSNSHHATTGVVTTDQDNKRRHRNPVQKELLRPIPTPKTAEDPIGRQITATRVMTGAEAKLPRYGKKEVVRNPEGVLRETNGHPNEIREEMNGRLIVAEEGQDKFKIR
jgi:hypothetical protein